MFFEQFLGEFRGPMVLFFCVLAILISTCNASSDHWIYVGGADKLDGIAHFTQLQNRQTGAIWLDQEIFDPFTATFSYRAVGGAGADCLVFMFYKYFDENLPSGSNLDFSDGSGYGIEFDSYINDYDPDMKHISLIKDSASNHIKSSPFDGLNDGTWHQVEIFVGIDLVEVSVDGSEELTWNSRSEFDKSYGYIGFLASTSKANDLHEIKDVVITTYNIIREPTKSSATKIIVDFSNPKRIIKGP